MATVQDIKNAIGKDDWFGQSGDTPRRARARRYFLEKSRLAHTSSYGKVSAKLALSISFSCNFARLG